MSISISDAGISFGNSAASQGLYSIGASVASNAITVTLDPCTIAFRSATLVTGTPVTVQIPSQLTLTIAATDSFAAVTAAGNQRIAILALYNGGTPILAASNLAGGILLDETNLITSATTATTATAIKAASVSSSSPYKVVGFIDAPFTTAVGYGALALVQARGGQALASMSSLGYGQTWQSFSSAQRVSGTTYYNTTGKPILVNVLGAVGASLNVTMTINGVTAGLTYASLSGNAAAGSFCGIVPPGNNYIITTAAGGYGVSELR